MLVRAAVFFVLSGLALAGMLFMARTRRQAFHGIGQLDRRPGGWLGLLLWSRLRR